MEWFDNLVTRTFIYVIEENFVDHTEDIYSILEQNQVESIYVPIVIFSYVY